MKQESIKKIPAGLIEVLGCPFCNGPLIENDSEGGSFLDCRACGLAFPVIDGIPDLMQKSAVPVKP